MLKMVFWLGGHVSQLFTSIEYWADEMQKGNPVDIIYVDFKTAFDKVPHERLLIN